MSRALQNLRVFSAAIVAVAGGLALGHAALAQSDDFMPVDPAAEEGGGISCFDVEIRGHPRCRIYIKEFEAWKLRQKAKAEAARAAAKERELLLERRAERQFKDTTLPIFRTTAPEWLQVGDRKSIAGLVGDDGSPPRLTVNGKSAPLFRPRAGDASIAKHTLAFSVDIEADEPGERAYVLEACDAANNCVAEKIVVTVGVAASNQPNVSARNFALIIGNDNYDHLPDLKTAVADATAVAEVLTRRYAFDRDRVKLLLDANRATILRQISDLRRELHEDDRLIIYYAGHGQIDPATEAGFWQPTDATRDDDFTWIPNDDLRRYLRGMPAKHVLIVADSCFSGSLTRGAPDLSGIPKDRFFTEIDSNVSRRVISSGGTEPVADAGLGGHSIFSYYFLKALNENERDYITSTELFNKLARAVTNNSNQKPEFGTVLNAGDEGSGDFTFMLRSGGILRSGG